MKKIISIAVLSTLCSAPLMHGTPPLAQYTSSPTERNATLSSFTSSPTPAWKKHLKTGALGAASAVFGGLALSAGVHGLRFYNTSRALTECAEIQKEIASNHLFAPTYNTPSYNVQCAREHALNSITYQILSKSYYDLFKQDMVPTTILGSLAWFCGKKALKNHRSN